MTSTAEPSLTAGQRIDALMKIHPKGYDLSLDRITRLLEKLGNPQNRLPPVIHVAGTNGKGSTIAFCRAILEAAGLSAHVHTSPHLVNWNERYRLGRNGTPGKLADDAVLSDAIRRVADANEGQAITVFEVLTAAMFVLFSEHPADVCLIEVGLGGRFDCTNVMEKTAVSVINTVSIDHEAYLGNTLAKIAFEKAGIIKPGVPVIIGRQEDEALETILAQATTKKAPATIFGQDFSASVQDGQLLFMDDGFHHFGEMPALAGDHQIENAALAIATTKALQTVLGFELTQSVIDAGMKNVQWPARMQRLPKGKLTRIVEPNTDIWVDGGHNPDAGVRIAARMQQMAQTAPAPLVMICGMLDTKDPAGYLQSFASLNPVVFTVPIVTSDAGIPAGKLAEVAKSCGFRAEPAADLADALSRIDLSVQPRILIAGSLYLAGDALDQNGTPPS